MHDICSVIKGKNLVQIPKKKAKLDGKDFVDKPGIAIVVRDLILPVFTDLSKPELLKNVYTEKHKTITNV